MSGREVGVYLDHSMPKIGRSAPTITSSYYPALCSSPPLTTTTVATLLMESPTKDIFLVIYSSRLFPSHWGVLVPSSNGSDVGTLINVIGDPSAGFEHEFKRNYGEEDSRRVSETLLLGKVASEHVKSRKEVGQNIDNVPNNTLEDIALLIPSPSKSLRCGSSSVSFWAFHFHFLVARER